MLRSCIVDLQDSYTSYMLLNVVGVNIIIHADSVLFFSLLSSFLFIQLFMMLISVGMPIDLMKKSMSSLVSMDRDKLCIESSFESP